MRKCARHDAPMAARHIIRAMAAAADVMCMQVQSDLDHARNGKLPFYRRPCIPKVADTGQYPRKGGRHGRKTANSWYPACNVISAAHPGHVSAAGVGEACPCRPIPATKT